MYATYNTAYTMRRQKVNKAQSNAGVYRVPDLVQFDQDQITDVPELAPVHLWLYHTITTIQSLTIMLYHIFPCTSQKIWGSFSP